MKYDKVFEKIGSKLNVLTEDERKNYINNTLPFITENIAIRPSSWDAMSKQSKEEFAMIFGGMADLLEMTGTKFNRLEKPSFDLFAL